MDCRVAARRPAGALPHAQCVVGTPDEKLAVADLLEMAFQTEVGIANGEELGIDRPVDIVTGDASFAQGVVLKGVRPTFVGVAAEATFILRHQRGATANVNGAFVRRMAGGAGQFAFRHRMMARQAELAAHVEMALEADRFLCAGRLDLQPPTKAAGLGAAGGETERRFRFAA